MIEKVVIDYLSNVLEVDAYLEVPRDKSTFLVIEKTGSSKEDQICKSTIAVQSYAPSLYETAMLNDSVKTAMEEMVELDVICDCSLNSDYNFTDTETKKYRYQAVFDITHY